MTKMDFGRVHYSNVWSSACQNDGALFEGRSTGEERDYLGNSKDHLAEIGWVLVLSQSLIDGW